MLLKKLYEMLSKSRFNIHQGDKYESIAVKSVRVKSILFGEYKIKFKDLQSYKEMRSAG